MLQSVIPKYFPKALDKVHTLWHTTSTPKCQQIFSKEKGNEFIRLGSILLSSKLIPEIYVLSAPDRGVSRTGPPHYHVPDTLGSLLNELFHRQSHA